MLQDFLEECERVAHTGEAISETELTFSQESKKFVEQIILDCNEDMHPLGHAMQYIFIACLNTADPYICMQLLSNLQMIFAQFIEAKHNEIDQIGRLN